MALSTQKKNVSEPKLDASVTALAEALKPGIEALGLPACFIGIDERYLVCNIAYEKRANSTRASIIGAKVRDVLPATEYETVRPHLQKALRDGKPIEYNRVFTGADGVTRWVLVHYHPQRLPSGEVVGVLATVTNADSVKALEGETVERERLLRMLTDSAGWPIVYADTKMTLKFANEPFLAWVGRTRADIVGKDALTVFGAAADFYKPYFARTLNGETVHFEAVSKVHEGATRHVHISMFADRHERGEVIGVFLVARDIEEEYQLKQKLMARESELRAFADSTNMAMTRSDRELRYEYVNAVTCQWLGRSEAELIGASWREVLNKREFADAESHAKRALAGEIVSYELRAAFPGQTKGQKRINMFPNRTVDGEIVGVYVVVADTEQDHQLRQELVEREGQLRLFTDNIPEAIGYLDHERRYRFVNNTFLIDRDLTRENVIGKTTTEVLGADVAAFVDPFNERAFCGETVSYEREANIFTAEGKKAMRWIRVRCVPDFDGDGKPKGIYIVGVDIHDSKFAENELRSAINSLPYPMTYVDKDLRFQFANKQLQIAMGKSETELAGRYMADVYGKERFAEIMPVCERVLSGESVSLERLIEQVDGSKRWMNVNYSPRLNAEGNVAGFYSAATDIDELKRTEIELRHANWRLSSHFENTPLAIVEWDAKFHVQRWSKQAERVFGWTEAEVLGKHINDWRFVSDEDATQLEQVTARMYAGGEKHATSLNRNYRKDGRTIWCDWYNSVLRNDAGRVVSILSLAHDVTARVQAEERLIHQATHDGLTGLPNRMMLQERLQHALMRARRSGERVAALFIDLDRFKEVNDTLGHRIGDEVLREIAARLSNLVRETDLLVRLSGDEFMVVVERVSDLESLNTVASKILTELRQPSLVEEHEIRISGSIGISIFPDDAEDVETLLKNADMAMYQAKGAGKNAFQRFSRDLAEKGTSMRVMESSLRAAVTLGQLVLFYQPKVDFKTQRIVGAEALIRWNHPKRGLIGPGEFIHLADDAGLVHEIGDWVLDTAFRQMRLWQDAGLDDIEIAVNLSAGQFSLNNLAESIIERIHRAGCNPKNVEVEVTETGMLRDPVGVGRTLTTLRDHGIRVAIDDFGTGYSSLSHLKRFPIDTLKIDRSFVADVLTDRDDAAIVSAVLALAKALDLRTVAEGVETEAQRASLAAQGCDSFQGFLFSKPLAAEDFVALVHQQRAGIAHH
jgi:diguanylate cyclase (GGDEF)-like protein/PAS domain S-box-containing protein